MTATAATVSASAPAAAQAQTAVAQAATAHPAMAGTASGLTQGLADNMGTGMTMDAAWFLKCVFAFAFVIALMYLLSWGMRKLGVAGQSMLPGNRRRMKIVEFLSLDHRRRLVLVRLDDKEHLIVLGPQGETVVQAGMPVPAVADGMVVDLSVQKEGKSNVHLS